ncbi:MAG: hypothetical protein KatS3mg031_0203 [Chitinophagales bacterium]|nr:MAG: hypothetical protein KatS3mg031_0203 [Chitinophagales bacterium]
MKKLCFAWLFSFLLFTSTAIAQSNKYQTAYFKVEEYKASEFKDTDALLGALEAINETVKNESAAQKPKTWYYKGLINHLIYENEAIASQHPDALFEASQGYQKALSITEKKFPEAEICKSNLYNLALQIQNKGAQLYNAGDYDNAYRHFMEVRAIKKFLDGIGYEKKLDDADATYNSVLCLWRLNKKEEAKKMLHELIDINYDSPAIYQILASFYAEDGNHTEALKVLEKGIKRYPENVNLLIDELNIYIKEGRETEAISKLEKAAELDPNNAQIYYVLGAAYDKAGKKEQAEAAYKKCIELDPENYSAYNNLGAIYYNEGIEINKEMMENTKLTDKQYKELTAKRNDLYRKAMPYFEKAYQIKSDDLGIIQALKEVYAKLEMYDLSKKMKGELERLKAKMK